jgi:hypothetical protein
VTPADLALAAAGASRPSLGEAVPLRSHGRHSNGHAHWTFFGSLALGRQQHGRPPRQSQPPAMPRNESDAKGAALASRSVDPGGHFFAGQCLVSDAWRARASYHLREVGLLGISSTLSACWGEGPTKAVRYRVSAANLKSRCDEAFRRDLAPERGHSA